VQPVAEALFDARGSASGSAGDAIATATIATTAAADATIFAFRRNVVVAASAGTGKTHRLTALYLLLALGLTSMGQDDDATAAQPVSPDRLVATTFSRAAALEISLRVERALGDLAAWDGSTPAPFEAVIRARAAALGRPLVIGAVRRRAADALARFPAAKIDTLHGVAGRIVKRNALAIGMGPGARVLDEEEAQALGDLAVDEALSGALAAGGERAEAARGLLASAGGVGLARRRILRLFDRLDEEGLSPRYVGLADHPAQARVVADHLAAIARACGASGSAGRREAALVVAAALARPAPGEILAASAAPAVFALLTERLPQRRSRAPEDDALHDFVSDLPGKTRADRAETLIALLRRAPELVARDARLLDVIADAHARLGAAKRRIGGLGFGDLLRIARDTLRDRPEISRATRESIDVLLVDELQDTSRVQRDLIYLLRERDDAAEARAAGVAPDARGLAPHGLFLVGDRKQSIYGFRGADVAVFSSICAELCGADAARALAMPEVIASGAPLADFVALRESRRSGAAILDFVNAFSEHDFTGERAPHTPPRAFEIAYGPAEHLVPASDHATPPRAAEVVFVRDDGASPDDAAPLVRESVGAAREAHVAAAFLAEFAADRVLGVAAPGRTEGLVHYRDVAILARRRSTIPLVELALARLEIPYVVAGRALFDAIEVRDTAAILRLLLDPRDRLALATVLRGPMVALSETSLAALSIPGRGLAVPLLSRWQTPDLDHPADTLVDPATLDPLERSRLEAFRRRYAELRATALRLAPAEAIRAAISTFDLDRVLAALPRAEARIGNIDRLVTLARRRGGTLASFVRWLDRRIHDEADEAEAAVFSPDDDAVRLTTIHASKGLDFPIVVLVDLNAEPRESAGGLGVLTDDGGAPRLVARHLAPRASSSVPLDPQGPLFPITTPLLRAAQADARAREQAERRRLTYVAITRPRDTLVLIGSTQLPRPGSAFQSLTAALADPRIAATITTTRAAADLLAAARPVLPRLHARSSRSARVPARPPRSPVHVLHLDSAPLARFNDCPRRFRLRDLLGLDEPGLASAHEGTNDPRARDRVVHRILERWPLARWGEPPSPAEITAALRADGLPLDSPGAARAATILADFLGSDLAAAVRAAGDAVARSRAFVLPIEPFARGTARLDLHGTIDLLIEPAAGPIDVLAYQLSSAGAGLSAARELELRAQALAVSTRAFGRPVRAGALFLDSPTTPVWLAGLGPAGALADDDHRRLEGDLAGLAARFAEARFRDRFDGVPRAACERLACGFIEACHPGKPPEETSS
jgi:ATP-dependent helicase/nuclease subunit A